MFYIILLFNASGSLILTFLAQILKVCLCIENIFKFFLFIVQPHLGIVSMYIFFAGSIIFLLFLYFNLGIHFAIFFFTYYFEIKIR